MPAQRRLYVRWWANDSNDWQCVDSAQNSMKKQRHRHASRTPSVLDGCTRQSLSRDVEAAVMGSTKQCIEQTRCVGVQEAADDA